MISIELNPIQSQNFECLLRLLSFLCIPSDIKSFCFFVFQLADAKDVMQAVNNLGGIRLPVLTPNLKVSISRINNHK